MKYLLGLSLALCTVFSVHFAQDSCTGNEKCNCSSINYTVTDPFPKVSLNCSIGLFIVHFPSCQLSHNKYNVSSVSLNNTAEPDCMGQEFFADNEPQVVINSPLTNGKCGTVLSVDGNSATFHNKLYIYPDYSPIITKNVLSADLNCTIPLTYSTQLNTTLKPKMTTSQISLPGVNGTVTVLMVLYKDEHFSEPYSETNTDLQVESFVYVAILIPNLDANSFAVKIDSIYATGTVNPTVYNLTLANGCPNPEYPADLIKILLTGNTTEARFKLKVFKIVDEDGVILKAVISVCLNSCIPNCTANSKAARSSSINTATLSLPLTATPKMTDNSGAIDRFSKTSASLLLLLSLLFVKFM